jgi:hypothetical protein
MSQQSKGSSTTNNLPNFARSSQKRWLKLYYFIRTAFSVIWVAAALTVGQHSPTIAVILLVAYPAWDAVANYLDASRSGGLVQNRTQTINVVVSVATTLVVIVALQTNTSWVLAVFGAWAILSGLLQLGTAVRRWKIMILSGGQSALAGAFFILQSRMPTMPSISTVAGYAAFGAVYFAISAVWLLVSDLRRKPRSV